MKSLTLNLKLSEHLRLFWVWIRVLGFVLQNHISLPQVLGSGGFPLLHTWRLTWSSQLSGLNIRTPGGKTGTGSVGPTSF